MDSENELSTDEVRQGEVRGMNKVLIWSLATAAVTFSIALIAFVR